MKENLDALDLLTVLLSYISLHSYEENESQFNYDLKLIVYEDIPFYLEMDNYLFDENIKEWISK